MLEKLRQIRVLEAKLRGCGCRYEEFLRGLDGVERLRFAILVNVARQAVLERLLEVLDGLDGDFWDERVCMWICSLWVKRRNVGHRVGVEEVDWGEITQGARLQVG